MGGGDLNLKKSWHTAKLSNIEDVWKREQEVERLKKVAEQRQKQLKEERAQEELRLLQEESGLLPYVISFHSY
jgi:Skp family chaperone for outer membrane proteins